MRSIIYIIVVILVISWLLGGFAFNVGGSAIHIIIVIAIILFLLNVFNGGSKTDRGRWY
ncbi:MAG: lmo0937 family membrane protein [Mucilaginibacter sp.]